MTRGAEGPARPDRKRVLGFLLLVLMLAALIGAAQIVPAQELLPLSSRGPGFSEADGMKWSLEPTRLLELVLPMKSRRKGTALSRSHCHSIRPARWREMFMTWLRRSG